MSGAAGHARILIMNVILIGYRGSGKTTIGRKLALQLWKDFVDVDTETCKRFSNDSIASIWKTHGEAAWREKEVEVTVELCGRDNLVIALGGGTLMQSGGRVAVEQAEDTVRLYLRCAATELQRRIEADAASLTNRPDLTDLGGGLEEIEAVLVERDPVYEAVADYTFDVTHTDVAETVRFLIQRYL